MKRINIVIIAIVAFIALVAVATSVYCNISRKNTNITTASKNSDSPSSSIKGVSPALTIKGNTYPFTVTDALGDTIVIEKKPEKIISLAPAATEILFKIGVGNRLVGVTEYCNYPPEVLELPKIGSYDTPSIELISAMKPDLVISVRGNKREVLQKIKEIGIKVISIDPVSFESLCSAMSIIGKVTDATEDESAVKKINETVNIIKTTSNEFKKKPLVLLLLGLDESMFTAGSYTTVDEIIKIAGGANLSDSTSGWYQISMEVVSAKNPDIIILSKYEGAQPLEDIKEKLLQDSKWKTISAVKNGDIYYINGEHINVSPRLLNGLEDIHAIIADFQGK